MKFLRNYLLAILAFFLCVNTAQAFNQIGSCLAGKHVIIFIIENGAALSSFGMTGNFHNDVEGNFVMTGKGGSTDDTWSISQNKPGCCGKKATWSVFGTYPTEGTAINTDKAVCTVSPLTTQKDLKLAENARAFYIEKNGKGEFQDNPIRMEEFNYSNRTACENDLLIEDKGRKRFCTLL